MAMGNHRHFFLPRLNLLRVSVEKGRRRGGPVLSNRTLFLSLIGLFLLFAGINHLISRPLESSVASPGEPAASAEPHEQQTRTPASTDPGISASEINEVIASHPKMIGSRFSGSGVLGVNLDSPEELNYFMSDEGRAEFFSRFKTNQNFDSAISDLEQAWLHASDDDLAKREALMEMSAGLTNFTESEALKARILGEFDKFNQSGQRPEARDYAAKALQEYLDHEIDPQKRNAELEKRGIPVLTLQPNKTNN
jgi:hypothetical protein